MSTIPKAASRPSIAAQYDAIVVGAGFAGLYMLYRLLKLGMRVTVLESGSGVGGTWFWNRYPGARCDVESLEYSYSFSDELQQEWSWTERYATQPEILSYLQHVAERFDLNQHIQLETRVTSAEFDEVTNAWTLKTDRDDVVTARYCIMATGCLSTISKPKVPGLEQFRGKTHYTGLWPTEKVDFTGLRVGVIGTGSSAIQAIPEIAKQAAHLYVFQRTANYSIPAHNAPLEPDHVQKIKNDYPQLRKKARASPAGVAGFGVPDKSVLADEPQEREQTLQKRWEVGGAGFLRAYNDVVINEDSNRVVADFVRGKIRQRVRDPEVAEQLIPTFFIGTKRVCVDTQYFETFNRENVTLVDVKRAPILEITAHGVRTENEQYKLDALVLATGFDAMTGALLAIDIRTTNGISLRRLWDHGPRTYLGLMTAGLPNMFMITGPGSPSVLSNVVVSIEQHVEWIADCLAHLGDKGITRIEAEEKAQEDWVAHVNEVADKTLLPRGASWYVGANIPGKPRVFMPYIGGVGVYRAKCDEVASEGYSGFRLSVASAGSSIGQVGD